MTVALRLALASDARPARAIAEAAYAPYVPLIGRRPIPMEADFEGQIAKGQVHVAEEAGTVLGYIVFYESGGTMLLENIAVAPEATGRGIGRALIAHCEAEARRLGLPAIVLYTNAKMTANLALYPRLGFVEIERRHEHGFDRVFFRKTLAL